MSIMNCNARELCEALAIYVNSITRTACEFRAFSKAIYVNEERGMKSARRSFVIYKETALA